MTETSDRVAETARRHHLSVGAVQALADAMARSRGGGLQWSHPDLGGMGQWTRSGMLQIGDMFNSDLKARVARALDDLAGSEPAASLDGTAGGETWGEWWPRELGQPSSTGAQNAMRYACFPDKRRLVVESEGRRIVYDTGSHRLTGFAQQQGDRQRLSFSGPDGRVTLDDLTIV